MSQPGAASSAIRRLPFVWPLVVLTLGAMAYDVALRALRRREG
ncbi:hypothetical protein [Streptomyces mirabilis]